MIVVATADFEVYHDVVGELLDRSVTFRTIEPGDDLPETAEVAIVGPEDDHPNLPTVQADPENPRQAIETALSVLRGARIGHGPTAVGSATDGRTDRQHSGRSIPPRTVQADWRGPTDEMVNTTRSGRRR